MTPLAPCVNLANLFPLVRLLAALAEHLHPVLVGVLDEMLVVDLAEALLRGPSSIALHAGAHADGLHRMVALDPVADVEFMDVLLDDVVAAEPPHLIPVADLVFHFRLARLAGVESARDCRSSSTA